MDILMSQEVLRMEIPVGANGGVSVHICKAMRWGTQMGGRIYMDV